MDLFAEYYPQILNIVTQVTMAIVAITAFVKSLKSEKRVVGQLMQAATNMSDWRKELENKVTITRAGIVQGFKEAVVTKDIKVSINTQVQKILDEKLNAFMNEVKRREEQRTQLTYWTLKVLRHTAAFNALTTEQQSELDEVMALIAEEDKIVDTIL